MSKSEKYIQLVTSCDVERKCKHTYWFGMSIVNCVDSTKYSFIDNICGIGDVNGIRILHTGTHIFHTSISVFSTENVVLRGRYVYGKVDKLCHNSQSTTTVYVSKNKYGNIILTAPLPLRRDDIVLFKLSIISECEKPIMTIIKGSNITAYPIYLSLCCDVIDCQSTCPTVCNDSVWSNIKNYNPDRQNCFESKDSCDSSDSCSDRKGGRCDDSSKSRSRSRSCDKKCKKDKKNKKHKHRGRRGKSCDKIVVHCDKRDECCGGGLFHTGSISYSGYFGKNRDDLLQFYGNFGEVFLVEDRGSIHVWSDSGWIDNNVSNYPFYYYNIDANELWLCENSGSCAKRLALKCGDYFLDIVSMTLYVQTKCGLRIVCEFGGSRNGRAIVFHSQAECVKAVKVDNNIYNTIAWSICHGLNTDKCSFRISECGTIIEILNPGEYLFTGNVSVTAPNDKLHEYGLMLIEDNGILKKHIFTESVILHGIINFSIIIRICQDTKIIVVALFYDECGNAILSPGSASLLNIIKISGSCCHKTLDNDIDDITRWTWLIPATEDNVNVNYIRTMVGNIITFQGQFASYTNDMVTYNGADITVLRRGRYYIEAVGLNIRSPHISAIVKLLITLNGEYLQSSNLYAIFEEEVDVGRYSTLNNISVNVTRNLDAGDVLNVRIYFASMQNTELPFITYSINFLMYRQGQDKELC